MHRKRVQKSSIWFPLELSSHRDSHTLLEKPPFHLLEFWPTWPCAACSVWGTVLNPSLITGRLVQRDQVWPSVCQQTDARALKTSFTGENKMDEFRSSSFGDFKDLTPFRKPPFLFLLRKQNEVLLVGCTKLHQCHCIYTVFFSLHLGTVNSPQIWTILAEVSFNIVVF